MLLHEPVVPRHEVGKMQRKKPEKWLHPEFLEHVIKNDIPQEELETLQQNHIDGSMDFHSPVSFEHIDPSALTTDPSDFHSEEYLEYRRRVFEELASEYGKQQSQQPYQLELISELPGEHGHYALSPTTAQQFDYTSGPHSNFDIGNEDDSSNSVEELPRDLSPSQQPAWDDSDLQSEPLMQSSSDQKGGDLRTNLLDLSDEEGNFENKALIMNAGNSNFTQNEDAIPSMHWTELEKQLEIMTKRHEDQEKSKKENLPSPTTFSPRSKRRSTKSHLQRQKNDRQAILQKFKEESETDTYPSKPWYNSRLPDQNLQICYINDSCSSSDNDENTSDSKTSPSKSTGKSSLPSSPALPSPGFGRMRHHPPYRMSSSSSLSSTSSNGHYTSSSSIPNDGEIINIRTSVNTDDIPKVRTKQEELEFQARVAITHAHQEARRLAEEERKRNRKASSSSFEKLLQVPLDDATRMKVKTRSLSREDCRRMTFGQLQVILNNMHMEKEALNSELKNTLEIRDELRTEQDAKLIDVDDMKVMLSATGPETTV